MVSKTYTLDIMRRNFPHIQASTPISNAVESRSVMISKNQLIRMNMNAENNVMFKTLRNNRAKFLIFINLAHFLAFDLRNLKLSGFIRLNNR